jgi:hypothetical protein
MASGVFLNPVSHDRRRSTLARLATALVAAWTCVAAPLLAQSATERDLKAAFLFHFAKFTDWPADALPATAPLVFCTTDADMSGALTSALANQSVAQHPVSVSVVKLDASARNCSVLYVGKIDRKKIGEIVAVLNGASVLTVGDAEEFAVNGGMIGLFVADGSMHFAINRGAVERTRLRLSAKLLQLATLVKDVR